MKMIWRSEHGKTFDVLFSESDPFLELKRIIKNHSDFLFYPSSCNARCLGNAETLQVNHEHRDVHFRVDDYDLTYFVFNYRISNIKIMTG